MPDTKPLLLVVTGPTASGKTKLAIDLAQHFGTEIVCADSRQIYADIPIGTAAPTAEERGVVPHHLTGFLPLDAPYSAAAFETDALRELNLIWQKHSTAVVCGGSMMYVDALINGIDEMPSISDGTRAYVLRLLEHHGLEGVAAQLQIVDPDSWDTVDRANPRRVVHALEVSLEAGVPYSSLRTGKAKERPFHTIKMAIDMPRQILFDRITARVDAMIAQGLVDEARRAFAMGDFNSLNTVGYKEMKMYLFEGADLDTVRDKIARNTRVYAKKQITWLKRDPTVHMLPYEDATAQALNLISSLREGLTDTAPFN